MATKILSSYLNEIRKQRIEVYYKIFISGLTSGDIHLNKRTVRHLGLYFNLINYVLVTSQEE